jgi:hypothetical protein
MQRKWRELSQQRSLRRLPVAVVALFLVVVSVVSFEHRPSFILIAGAAAFGMLCAIGWSRLSSTIAPEPKGEHNCTPPSERRVGSQTLARACGELRDSNCSPTAAPSANHHSESPPSDCAICLHELRGTEGIVSLPCQHKFHRVCALRWMEHCGGGLGGDSDSDEGAAISRRCTFSARLRCPLCNRAVLLETDDPPPDDRVRRTRARTRDAAAAIARERGSTAAAVATGSPVVVIA